MSTRLPSALITDQGRRVHLRLEGQHYDLSQNELRTALGLAAGPPGLGITIEHNRFVFEFTADHQTVELSAAQLRRRLGKHVAASI